MNNNHLEEASMIAQSRRGVRRERLFALAFATALLMPLVPGGAYAASFCIPGDGDKPETSLQGGLTTAERDIPGGFQGQWCGMRQVGHEPLALRGSFGDVQLMGLCAYASMRDPSDLTLPTTGTAVIDMRVPSAPVWTQTLRSPAMQRAYSALEIQKQTLVGAFKDFGPMGNNWFDIYDVSGDCLNPTLVKTTTTTSGNHDGWLTPDTKYYYGIPFGGVRILSGPADAPVLNPARIDMHVLDMSDPANPKHLLNWNRLQLPAEVQPRVLATTNFHDVSTNDDGTRVYLALYGGNNSLGGNNNNPIPAQNQRCSNGLLILDSSDIAHRVPNPQLRYVSFVSWCDPTEPKAGHYFDPDFDDGSTASAHATEYVIHENGKEYIVTTDESGAGLDGEWTQHPRQRTFGRLIDISDERNPRIVSTFKPDVNDPDNVARVLAEQINGGMIHYIGFDDRYNMRLVFYAGANYGIRVVDFRDPERPKEIAYYKAPSVATTRAGENDFTRPDPRYDAANCLLYTGWNQGGLRVLELTNPEYNPCMRRIAKGDGFIEVETAGGWHKRKEKISFEFAAGRVFQDHRKRPDHWVLDGRLELKDDAADARVRVKDLTLLGSVRDACGTVLPTATSVQFDGSGTFNGRPATFRVCVQDNGKGRRAAPDRFFITCKEGCTYSAGGEVDGGRIEVDQPHGHRHRHHARHHRHDHDRGDHDRD